MKAKETSQMNMNRLALGKVIPLRTPLAIHIEPSRVCNFKCNFCFRFNGKELGNSILSMPLAKKSQMISRIFPTR